MKVRESFVVNEPPDRLWRFFERVDQVARCVPGVDAVAQIDEESSQLRVTQAVGPMRATFDMRMRITERRPRELLRFTATGRAIRGATGNVRSVNTVQLQAVDGGTRIGLEADVALGGVLGSVGQKVVQKQAAQVTREFSEALERALRGEPVGPPSATAAPESAARPAASLPEPPAPTPRTHRAREGFRFGFGLGLGLGSGAGLSLLIALALRRLMKL